MGNFPHFYFDFIDRIGMKELEKEIEQIRYELAITIPEELKNAMYSGDILESSEYSEILSRQNLLSTRLNQLNRRINANKIIDVKHISRTHVDVGSTVTLSCLATGDSRTVRLVVTEISDVPTYEEEVTLQSPMGKALYNKTLNDELKVYTPQGIHYYKIISLTTIHENKKTT